MCLGVEGSALVSGGGLRQSVDGRVPARRRDASSHDFFAAARQVWGIKDRARGEFRASGRGAAARRQGVRVAEKKKRFCSSNKRYRPGGRIQGHLQPHYIPTRSPGLKMARPPEVLWPRGAPSCLEGGQRKTKGFAHQTSATGPPGPYPPPPPTSKMCRGR